MDDLRKKPDAVATRGFNALVWAYSGTAVRVLLQIGAQIALARILGPEAYGAAAAAILIATVLNLVAELGLGAALVQSRAVGSGDVQVVFGSTLAAALVCAGAFFAVSDWIGAFFDDPRVGGVARLMAVAVVLQAAGIVPGALLRRHLDYRSIQQAQIAGYVIGFPVVGILFAYHGFAERSFGAAWIGQAAVTSALMWRAVAKVARHDFPGRSQGLVSFAGSALSTNLVNWAIDNLDNFLIGRFFGTATLGSYAAGYNLVRTAANQVVLSLQQVLFPVSARKSAETRTLVSAYVLVLWGLSLVVFPVFLGISAASSTVVQAIFGSKWSSSAAYLVPLALAMPLHAIMSIAGPVLWGRGRPGVEFRVQLGTVVLLFLALVAASFVSAVAMAWAVLLVYGVRAFWLTFALARETGTDVLGIGRAILPGAFAGGITMISVGLVDGYLKQCAISTMAQFASVVATGALVSLVAVLSTIRWMAGETVRAAVAAVSPSMPLRFQRILCGLMKLRIVEGNAVAREAR